MSDPKTAACIRENVSKLHTAINDGSLDRATVDASLKALTAHADELDGSKKKADEDKADNKFGLKTPTPAPQPSNPAPANAQE